MGSNSLRDNRVRREEYPQAPIACRSGPTVDSVQAHAGACPYLERSTFHNFTVLPLPAARVFPSGENETP